MAGRGYHASGPELTAGNLIRKDDRINGKHDRIDSEHYCIELQEDFESSH
jgi:hypothetical protein